MKQTMRGTVWAVACLAAGAVGLGGPAGIRDAALPEFVQECYIFDGFERCVHHDEPPPGIEFGHPLDRYPQYHSPSGALAPAKTEDIECYGDGVTGPRVQPIYAYATSDRRATVVPQIVNTYAPRVEAEINESAKATGGGRHVRWVTDADCNLSVQVLRLEPDVLNSPEWRSFESALIAAGLTRTDRIYIVWADASQLCGLGGVFADDRPMSVNRNARGPNYSRIDTPCWGYADSHELMHNLGGVQRSAPNASAYWHCTDEWDRMCYADGPGTVLSFANAGPSGACRGRASTSATDLDVGNERRFDCNNDDYFSTNPAPGSYLDTKWNTARSPFLSSFEGQGIRTFGAYHPLESPFRVTDTRQTSGRLSVNQRLALRVTAAPSGTSDNARVPVPAEGTAAVVLNVTVVDAQGDGFLSVRPYAPDLGVPAVSNLNYTKGQTVANLVTVPIAAPPSTGLIDVYSSSGSPYVLVDIIGFYADGAGLLPQRGGFHALTPSRIFDTRSGIGGSTTLGPNQTVKLRVTNIGDIPSANVSSVVLTVTAVDATAASYLTVWASDQIRPTTSNLNFSPGPAVPNLVVSRVAADGTIAIFNESGSVNVVADVAGWFDNGALSITEGYTFRAVNPARVADTRSSAPLANAQTRTFPIAGAGGVPTNARAAVANITAVDPTGGGYLTVYPAGQPRPSTSTVNFRTAQTVPNLAYAALGAGGALDIFHEGEFVHVVIDIAGYFA